MKKLKIQKLASLLLFSVLCSLNYVVAQEEWEPQKHITGYINTIAELTDLKS